MALLKNFIENGIKLVRYSDNYVIINYNLLKRIVSVLLKKNIIIIIVHLAE